MTDPYEAAMEALVAESSEAMAHLSPADIARIVIRAVQPVVDRQTRAEVLKTLEPLFSRCMVCNKSHTYIAALGSYADHERHRYRSILATSHIVEVKSAVLGPYKRSANG